MEYYSDENDTFELALALKNKLGSKISINAFGLPTPILYGKYNGKTWADYVRFGIKYNKEYFLRLQINTCFCTTRELELEALQVLSSTISSIKKENDEKIGSPTAFYTSFDGGDERCLTAEWAFSNINEYKIALQNNTIFDDGGIVEDLTFVVDSFEEYKKKNELTLKLK